MVLYGDIKIWSKTLKKSKGIKHIKVSLHATTVEKETGMCLGGFKRLRKCS
jgi:hypothetical protein